MHLKHIFLITTLVSFIVFLFPLPLWYIFNIHVIVKQPGMSHLGMSLFPLHLRLLFNDANSPSNCSSVSLLLWILKAMLISMLSQQLSLLPKWWGGHS